MDKKYKELLDNTLIFTLGKFGSRMITFLLVPLYTNVLSVEEYGTGDFVITCSYLIVPIISLVFQDAILRFGLKEGESRNQVALNSFIVFCVGTLVTFLMIPVWTLYESLNSWKWYLTALIISNNACNIFFTYAKVKNQNKLFAFSSILQTFILAVINILLLVVFKYGVKGYLMANIVANIVPAIFIIFKTNIIVDACKARFNIKLFNEMLVYSIPLIANNLSWWVLNSSNRVMIEYFISASALGLYTAASKIPAFLSIITSVFSSAWSISSIKDYDSSKDKYFYSNIFKIFSTIMHLGASFIILTIKPLMFIYVGHEFFKSWVYVPFLVLGAVYFAYSTFFGAIYGAVKKNKMVTITTLVAAVVNISFNMLLIPYIGIMAASIATLLGYATIGFYRMFNSKKYFSFPIDYKTLFLNSFILIIQCLCVTYDLYGYAISIVALCSLIIINIDDLRVVYNKILRRKV